MPPAKTANACGSAGCAAYVRLEIGDLFYPAALGVLLLVASASLLRRFGGRSWPVLLPIIVMTVLDYTENTGIWVLLAQWPDVNAAVADIAGIVTAVKRVLGFVSFAIPLVLLAIEIVHRGRQRMNRRRVLSCEQVRTRAIRSATASWLS